MANLDERRHTVLASLGECRTALVDSGDREAAFLVSVAILELRMKLNRIADSELRALCEAMLPQDDLPAQRLQAQRRGPLLKLVK